MQPRAVQPRAVQPGVIEPRAMEPRAMEPHAMESHAMEPHAMEPHAMEPHIILSVELLESQQKADVVKTDYSDSLLMITRLKTRMIITIDAAHI